MVVVEEAKRLSLCLPDSPTDEVTRGICRADAKMLAQVWQGPLLSYHRGEGRHRECRENNPQWPDMLFPLFFFTGLSCQS